MITFRIDKTVRIGAETHEVLERMMFVIAAWSGGDDELVHFYEPQSLCFQRTSPPFAFWRIDGAAFQRFGPLPFTAGGKPVGWSWWYQLRNSPRLTVLETDLPDDADLEESPYG